MGTKRTRNLPARLEDNPDHAIFSIPIPKRPVSTRSRLAGYHSIDDTRYSGELCQNSPKRSLDSNGSFGEILTKRDVESHFHNLVDLTHEVRRVIVAETRKSTWVLHNET